VCSSDLSKRCDVLHVFVVSEDVSLVPLATREELVRRGSAHLSNLVYHRTGSYMISNATFPSYFLKDEDAIIQTHAQLDIAVFVRIATQVGILSRFVGEEPLSHVTNLYNQIMTQGLSAAGLECVVIPRKQIQGEAISASRVREYLRQGDFSALAALVPATTLEYFHSSEAEPVVRAIRACEDVTHY
jgi:[citrate (pro-3S)-lyase] ligase